MSRFISSFFKNQDIRSKTLYYNILTSFFFRFVNIIIGFLLIPILIRVLDVYQYGVWLTISSLVIWINYFDIGLGNGLKNKLGESLAKGDKKIAQEYVSTSYFLMILISILLFGILTFFLNYFDAYKAFNIQVSKLSNLHTILYIVLISTLLNFITKLLDNVLFALQKTSIITIKLAISQLTILIFLYIISIYYKDNALLYAILALAFIPVIYNFIFGFYFYLYKYKFLCPNVRSINIKHFKSLFSLGISFFLIQIGVLVMFQSQTLILIKVLGPEAVTSYSISYKFYTILYMLMSIIIVPFWSGALEAFGKNDFIWLKTKVKQLLLLNFVLLIFVNIVLIFFDKYILEFWLGQEFKIGNQLKYSLLFYTILLSFLTISMNLINGAGKLRMQLILYVVAMIVNVPLSYFLILYFNISGVVYSSIIIFVLMNLILWKQVNLILNKNAYGLWNK